MRIIFSIALISCCSFIGFAQIKTYKGAWFDIKYPSGFTAKGSLKSASAAQGYESAVFTSPDKLVQFYVFSPQWNGEATDIALKATEKISNTQSKFSGKQETKWWTITAKDGSYSRSYQEKKNEELNVSWVLGIKYKNQAAFNRYKKNYGAFKRSLVQYAD